MMSIENMTTEVDMILGVNGYHADHVFRRDRHRIAAIVRTLAKMANSYEDCAHHLGGGACRLNLESECCEGGGFEAWEQKAAN